VQAPGKPPWVRKEKNNLGSETTPYINKGKGDILARRAVSSSTRKKEESVRICRVASRPLLQTGELLVF